MTRAHRRRDQRVPAPAVAGEVGRCVWCGSTFPASAPGGNPRRFCSAVHRGEFHTAARLWAMRAIDAGLISVEALRGVVSTAAAHTENNRKSVDGND